MPTQTTILPFEKVTDVNVNMVISKPAPVKGLGNLCIFHKVTGTPTLGPADTDTGNTGGTTGAGGSGTQTTNPSDAGSFQQTVVVRDAKGRTTEDIQNGVLLRMQDPDSKAVYKEFSDLDALEGDYDETSDVYRKAEAYFAQPNFSDKIAVLDYSTDIDKALKAFWQNDWTFAIFAVSDTFDDETLKISNIFEANKDHFLVLQTQDISKFAGYSGQDWTIGVEHMDTEAMDAALVGALANEPVGSITWKFKQLNGITAENLTAPQVRALKNMHAIGYIHVGNRDMTSEGTTLSGEYIDNEHGDLWIKTHIEGSLEDTLQTYPKLSYDAKGIAIIYGRVYGVLKQAWEQGIVLDSPNGKSGEFKVITTPREAQPIADLSARRYAGLKFTYHRSGAIHSIVVNGVVMSDTITG